MPDPTVGRRVAERFYADHPTPRCEVMVPLLADYIDRALAGARQEAVREAWHHVTTMREQMATAIFVSRGGVADDWTWEDECAHNPRGVREILADVDAVIALDLVLANGVGYSKQADASDLARPG